MTRDDSDPNAGFLAGFKEAWTGSSTILGGFLGGCLPWLLLLVGIAVVITIIIILNEVFG